jgi:hypothetical protein
MISRIELFFIGILLLCLGVLLPIITAVVITTEEHKNTLLNDANHINLKTPKKKTTNAFELIQSQSKICEQSFYQHICNIDISSNYSNRTLKSDHKNFHQSAFDAAMGNNHRLIKSIIEKSLVYKSCKILLKHHPNSRFLLFVDSYESNTKINEFQTFATRMKIIEGLFLEGHNFFYRMKSQKDDFSSHYTRIFFKNNNICWILKEMGKYQVIFKDWYNLQCLKNGTRNDECIIGKHTINQLVSNLFSKRELKRNSDDVLYNIGCIIYKLTLSKNFKIFTERHFQIFYSGLYNFYEDLLIWNKESSLGGRVGSKDHLRIGFDTEYICTKFTRKYTFENINRIFFNETSTQLRIDFGNIYEILKNIKTSLKKVIRETKWLSWEASNRISKKIDEIQISILKPPRQLTKLEIAVNRMVNRLKISRNILVFQKNVSLKKIQNSLIQMVRLKNENLYETSTPSRNFTDDRLHWSEVYDFYRTPFETVNAWYSPVTNTISVPAGILQDPIFAIHPTFKQKVFIGSIVGHELGHSVDVHGLMFNKYGNYDKLKMNLKEKTRWFSTMQCLEKEYSRFCDSKYFTKKGRVFEKHISKDRKYGERTLGENIADQLGIKTALIYFRNHLLGECSSRAVSNVVETCARKFFQSYAEIWCTWKNRNLTIGCGKSMNHISRDVHAKPQHRVDIALRQNELFRKYYGCHKECYMSNPNPCVIYS